ncbi:uncharacterized protein [Melopsittacus undulatus]|uniref:uncharacterized protein isoform X3 n=1 Tax=Melopsittacus undulatus TaxID=13146 RepID=UPI00146A3FBE|nr:uncharacterized protein LOC117437368 isoform X3 [Melopsittacus undulatus]
MIGSERVMEPGPPLVPHCTPEPRPDRERVPAALCARSAAGARVPLFRLLLLQGRPGTVLQLPCHPHAVLWAAAAGYAGGADSEFWYCAPHRALHHLAAAGRSHAGHGRASAAAESLGAAEHGAGAPLHTPGPTQILPWDQPFQFPQSLNHMVGGLTLPRGSQRTTPWTRRCRRWGSAGFIVTRV